MVFLTAARGRQEQRAQAHRAAGAATRGILVVNGENTASCRCGACTCSGAISASSCRDHRLLMDRPVFDNVACR